MDKLVNQLKERFEFKFIHPSIYNVGYKILTLIESGDYGSHTSDVAINKFINKNLELDNFCVDNHTIQLKQSESYGYAIEDLMNDIPIECNISFSIVFDFIKNRMNDDNEFKATIQNYLNHIVYNNDYKVYVVVEN